jgi:hypothetical protein
MMNTVLFSDLIGQSILSSIVQKDIDDPFYEQNTKSGEFVMFEFFNGFVRDLTFEIMIFINLNNWITYAITIEEQSALKKNKMAIPISSKHRKVNTIFMITLGIFLLLELIAYI